MYPHRIRLRGPWDLTLPHGEPRRVMFPATWKDVGLPDYVGSATFARRFGYPGHIDAHERVWLVGQGMAGPAEIHFQDEPLGTVSGRFAFEVTAHLRERNMLRVTLDIVAGHTRLWDDIALEVRATAFLEDIVQEGLIVRGRIAGTSAGPLEVYALAADRTCGYCVAHAGGEFEITCDAPPSRVELINVATVWDVLELEFAL
jgi:hypothetical protein